MRILFIGDVVGRSGRDALTGQMPSLRQRLRPDFVIVNGENAAAGFGITARIAANFYESGVDAITLGNHTWDQKELVGTIDKDPRMARPANFPEGTPGRGAVLVTNASGRRVLIINLMARLYMEALDCPFQTMDRVLRQHRLTVTADAIIVDFHGEATSEKMAMGHFLDGRVSLVVGTHSHVPTADHQILPGGTAYLSDAGMTGDYDSVIGMRKDAAVSRFLRRMPGERLVPSEGEATIAGLFCVTDDRTGLATQVAPLRLGGRLAETVPDV